MQIECAYCSKLTHDLPLCHAPLCTACCERCRKAMGGCPAAAHLPDQDEAGDARAS